MASPTTRGKYKKQALGEGLNTWGLTSGLNGLFDVMDEALHGVNEITLTGTAYTLTSTNYTTNDIRFRQFKFTGNFAATITIPATQNWWIIENATGQTLTFDNGSNSATLANTFYGLLTTNGTTVSMLTLPDGTNVATVANAIGSVNTVAGAIGNVNTVAGLNSEIALLGTADAVADMNTLAVADVISDMNTLATPDIVSDMNTLAVADVVSDMNTLATADVVSDMNTLATADIVADMNALATTAVINDMALLGDAAVIADMALLADADVISDMNTLATADVVADMNTLATADVVADMNTLATADVVADMNTLATADVVSDMNTLATADVVADMNTLGTADVVNDMNVLGTAANVTHMATLADIQDGTVATNAITTVATNVADVTNYSSTYLGPKSSAPTQRNDGTALQAGDLVFRTDLDQMQVRNAANNAWATVAVTASNFLTVANNLSDLNSAATARTNLGLGSIATQASATVLQTSNNLSDVTAATARTNLGLGSIATQASNSVSITGGAISGITDLAVADGGTGVGTHTQYGVLVGAGTGAVHSTAAGTAGQVLTAQAGANPVWADAAGGGAWTYIATAGTTSASDISFNQIFSSSYDVYLFVGTKIKPVGVNNKTLQFIFKTGSGNTAQTGDWIWQIDYGGSTSGNNTYNSISTGNSDNNEMLINYETQDSGDSGFNLNQNFYMYCFPNDNTLRASGGSAVANYPQVITHGISTSDYNSGTVNKCHGIGMWRDSTAVTGCKFMYDGGANIYGDIDAYGLKFS